MKKTYLPAEWHKQSLIQLTWPHIDTDWAYMLEEVDACFLNIAYEILKRQPLLVVAPEPHRIGDRIYEHGCNVKNLTVSAVKTNDTWARDHAFITMLKENGEPLLLDFCFNGWGMKYAANYDNMINSNLYYRCKTLTGEYVYQRNFILEGGSIESDGKGTLLTTEKCLLSYNRNEKTKEETEQYLKETFNLKHQLEQSLLAMLKPLKTRFSEEKAGLPLGGFAAGYGMKIAEMEGALRLLWGLTPYWAGGGTQAEDWKDHYLNCIIK